MLPRRDHRYGRARTAHHGARPQRSAGTRDRDGGRRLHRCGVLVHQLYVVRRPRRHHRPYLRGYLRRHRTTLSAPIPSQITDRRRYRSPSPSHCSRGRCSCSTDRWTTECRRRPPREHATRFPDALVGSAQHSTLCLDTTLCLSRNRPTSTLPTLSPQTYPERSDRLQEVRVASPLRIQGSPRIPEQFRAVRSAVRRSPLPWVQIPPSPPREPQLSWGSLVCAPRQPGSGSSGRAQAIAIRRRRTSRSMSSSFLTYTQPAPSV